MFKATLLRWLAITVVLLCLLAPSTIVRPADASEPGAPPSQQQPPYEVDKQEVIDALATWFATFQRFEFARRKWILIGDLDLVRARVNQWDVQVYVDPAYLQKIGANAAYVDYTYAGLGYFNDLVLADRPADIPGVTLWHEVMHSIFDVHDSELLVSNDEMYTWYMEGVIRGLGHLMNFERELQKGPNCDPQQLDRHWRNFEHFMTKVAPDFGGYGALNDAQKRQLCNLTGFCFPLDVGTLRQRYEDAGLLDQCIGTPTPTPVLSPTPGPTPTPGATPVPGQVRASRLFLMDNSGSMQGAKIATAIRSAQSVLSGLPADTEVAVQFFGTVGCDVQIVQEFTLDHAAARSVIASAQATGDTPLAAAIQQGGAYMRANAHSSDLVMILLTDGEETCGGDPVGAARGLNAPGPIARRDCAPRIADLIELLSPQPVYAQGQPPIRLHVVGFGIEPGSPTEEQLKQIAEAGNGKYFSAEDEQELTQSLKKAAETRAFPNWLVIAGAGVLCLTLLVVGVMAIRGLTSRPSRPAAPPRMGAPPPISAPESLAAPRPPGVPERMWESVPPTEGLTRRCPECGAEIQPGARFCSKCGARLRGGREDEFS